jgi:transposase
MILHRWSGHFEQEEYTRSGARKDGKKRTYNRAFKLQALELVKTSQKSINEIERDLGITPGLLHKWKARMKVDGQQAFPGKGRLKEDEELIRRLKRENEVLRQEREVLKKALAIFSERPGKATSL